MADERTRHQRVQRSKVDGDLTAIDRHRIAARIVEIGRWPGALRDEAPPQVPDVKRDLRRQVEVDVAHLRFDDGCAGASVHEGGGDDGRNREEPRAHGVKNVHDTRQPVVAVEVEDATTQQDAR